MSGYTSTPGQNALRLPSEFMTLAILSGQLLNWIELGAMTTGHSRSLPPTGASRTSNQLVHNQAAFSEMLKCEHEPDSRTGGFHEIGQQILARSLGMH